MSKATVILCAGYNASEQTFCAAFFAAYIASRWRYTLWAAPENTQNDRYRGFSPKWDSKIIPFPSKAERFSRYLQEDRKIEMCLFFEENELLYSLLPKTTKTAFFLNPYKWNGEQSRMFAKKCTHVLSVSPYITKKLVQPNLFEHEVVLPFHSAMVWVPKTNMSPGQTATLFYNAYGMSFSERQCIRQVAETVKTCCPQSKYIIGYYDTQDTSEPGRDAGTSYFKLMEYLQHTDWIIDLNPRPLFGFFAAVAGTIGAQWSGFDLPPNNDEYSAARRHLIPYFDGGLCMPNVSKIAEHIVRQMSQPFDTDLERNQEMWSYLSRTSQFFSVMNNWFKPKKSKAKKAEEEEEETSLT